MQATGPQSASSADYIRVTATALVVEDEAMDRDRWAEILRQFGRARLGTTWHIGDLLAFGKRSYGDGTYKLAAKALDKDIGSLRNMASVSRRVAPEIRQPDLSWRAHRVVAKLEPDSQRHWLAQAAQEGWTADGLEQAIGESGFPTKQNDDLDPSAHWVAAGMPDYEQDEEPPYKVVVNFDTEADRDEFLTKIESPVIHNRSGRTLSVWQPDRPKDDVQAVEFV